MDQNINHLMAIAEFFNHDNILLMENINSLDLVIGGLALLIVVGGLLMLFQGISAINDKKD